MSYKMSDKVFFQWLGLSLFVSMLVSGLVIPSGFLIGVILFFFPSITVVTVVGGFLGLLEFR